jgi:hypothetical protein
MAGVNTRFSTEGLTQGTVTAFVAAKVGRVWALLTTIRQHKLIASLPTVSSLTAPETLYRHPILMLIKNKNLAALSVFPQRGGQRISGCNIAQRYRVPVRSSHFARQGMVTLITDLNNKLFQPTGAPLNMNCLSHEG